MHTRIEKTKDSNNTGDRRLTSHDFEGVGLKLKSFGENENSPVSKTMTNYDNKEEVNEFVGIAKNGDYIFLDYLFESGRIHGATGTRLMPVSKEYVEERIETIKDYEWSPIAHIYDEEQTPLSWDEWLEENWSRRDFEDLAVDPSGGGYWHKVEELCEYHEDFEFYMTDCIGGGRMFSDSHEADPENYRYLENPELLEKAKQAENGEYFE